MALRFFADHCVPRSVGTALASDGHETLLLRDHLAIDAADSTVIAKAQDLDSILISLNGDFADLVTYPPAVYKGIVALQVRNHPQILGRVVDRLRDFITAHPEPAEYYGKLLVVESHRIRIRE